ncbi:hypothetical protein BHE74_00031957, partial [Ensete ventricosum]
VIDEGLSLGSLKFGCYDNLESRPHLKIGDFLLQALGFVVHNADDPPCIVDALALCSSVEYATRNQITHRKVKHVQVIEACIAFARGGLAKFFDGSRASRRGVWVSPQPHPVPCPLKNGIGVPLITAGLVAIESLYLLPGVSHRLDGLHPRSLGSLLLDCLDSDLLNLERRLCDSDGGWCFGGKSQAPSMPRPNANYTLKFLRDAIWLFCLHRNNIVSLPLRGREGGLSIYASNQIKTAAHARGAVRKCPCDNESRWSMEPADRIIGISVGAASCVNSIKITFEIDGTTRSTPRYGGPGDEYLTSVSGYVKYDCSVLPCVSQLTFTTSLGKTYGPYGGGGGTFFEVNVEYDEIKGFFGHATAEYLTAFGVYVMLA